MEALVPERLVTKFEEMVRNLLFLCDSYGFYLTLVGNNLPVARRMFDGKCGISLCYVPKSKDFHVSIISNTGRDWVNLAYVPPSKVIYFLEEILPEKLGIGKESMCQ